MLILILVLIFESANFQVYAVETHSYFARIMYDQVYLYRSDVDDDSISNIYFELPKTYFVEIFDESDIFYHARYQNITGYVKKNSVQAVRQTPAEPFLNNVTFRVYSELSERLYSLPNSNSNLIIKIPNLTTNIQYLGKVHGEQLIEGRTDIWYYCKFTSNADNYGYVFSDFCDEMPKIQDNLEQLDYINNPIFKNDSQIQAIPQNSNSVGLIIGILSIPALIFMLMLVKGTKILSGEKIKRKEVIDY